MNRSHLKYNNSEILDRQYKPVVRYPGDVTKEDIDNPDYYSPKVEEYQRSLKNYKSDYAQRQNERNVKLNIPEIIDCIELEFHDVFNSKDFEHIYNNDFGIGIIRYTNFNKNALFYVWDDNRFKAFIRNIENFINCQDHNNPNYNRNIKFIKAFRFHSKNQILSKQIDIYGTIILHLIEGYEIRENKIIPIKNRLINYLKENNKNVVIGDDLVEIKNADKSLIEEIAKNFDIVHYVNSSNWGVIRPSAVNIPTREFSFSVKPSNENITIIGVIDTGVSSQSPISPILVNTDNRYHIANGNPLIDDFEGGLGHGTGVAAFAALGKKLSGDVKGLLSADAKILSIKILTSDFKLAIKEVIELIEKANEEDKVDIFVLAVTPQMPIENNSNISDYAYLLDRISYEKDILVFISTGNINDNIEKYINQYPYHFQNEETNLFSPGESMNNLTIGAIGDNLLPDSNKSITPINYPTVYTRKFHLVRDDQKSPNKHLFKPDLVFSGGNYEHADIPYIPYSSEGDSAIQYLAGDKRYFSSKSVGTSYSTPLVANIAAKIKNKYPDLRNQTIKGILINSAEQINWEKNNNFFTKHTQKYISGHGIPNESKCLFSNDNEATLVIEDEIKIGNLKVFKLVLPEYLCSKIIHKKVGVIEIITTLCYSFPPINNNQVIYCPYHIGFIYCQNITDNYYEKCKTNELRIVNGWSQDAYYGKKILSNVQKERFTLGKEKIFGTDNILKLAINSHYHKYLTKAYKSTIPSQLNYSLIIKIRENQLERNLTGKLYDQLVIDNKLSVITEIEAELEAESEI